MKLYKHELQCPNCSVTITLPILPKLEAQAKENYDMAETSAQEELLDLQLWLWGASLFGLIQFWFNRNRLHDERKDT